MKNRKISILMLILVMCIGNITGCGKTTKQESDAIADSVEIETDKMGIVCTTFPQYDWVKNILGEQIDEYDLTLLLDSGVDLHNYQPTAEDISKIADCDLFIYVGGESDAWVDSALKESVNDNMKTINMMELLGSAVKEEEVKEGMEIEEHGEEAAHEEDEVEYDEHIWLSLKNAQSMVEKIQNTVCDLDPENTEVYHKNAEAYIAELKNLDSEYEAAVQTGKRTVILFGDRFPFRYMADDYGLDYYAAFTGCSAETEASFETITFLTGKVDELQLPVILTLENSDEKIAVAIRENSAECNQQILQMNSLQSVTSKDVEEGFSYLQAMGDNLEVLKQALN